MKRSETRGASITLRCIEATWLNNRAEFIRPNVRMNSHLQRTYSRLKLTDYQYPQHGAIYRGADVKRFINCFADLEVGSGIKD